MTDHYQCFRKFDCFVNIIAELFVFHRKHCFATTIFVHHIIMLATFSLCLMTRTMVLCIASSGPPAITGSGPDADAPQHRLHRLLVGSAGERFYHPHSSRCTQRHSHHNHRRHSRQNRRRSRRSQTEIATFRALNSAHKLSPTNFVRRRY
jgi:hypothetical protein